MILRQFRLVLLDPYANAFYRDLSGKGEWQNDRTPMRGGNSRKKVGNRLAVLCCSSGLSLWKVTGDGTAFYSGMDAGG